MLTGNYAANFVQGLQGLQGLEGGSKGPIDPDGHTMILACCKECWCVWYGCVPWCMCVCLWCGGAGVLCVYGGLWWPSAADAPATDAPPVLLLLTLPLLL